MKNTNINNCEYWQLENGPKPLDYVWIKKYIGFKKNQKELCRIYISEYVDQALNIHGLFRHGSWK